MVGSLPVHRRLRESRFAHRILDFGQTPKAPAIGECTLHFAAVGEAEVNVIDDVAGDRVVLVLIPHVGEAIEAAFFLDFAVRFATAVGVAEEQTVL